jgi:hypothetical protein
VFSHIGTDRSPLSVGGGVFGGMGLMRGMERERGGVLVGRVMMSQPKLQQEENTEMVQHFF